MKWIELQYIIKKKNPQSNTTNRTKHETICESSGSKFWSFRILFEAKGKEGIFVGPQIKTIMNSDEFTQLLITNEEQAWNSLKDVVNGFLGNNRADNYQ